LEEHSFAKSFDDVLCVGFVAVQVGAIKGRVVYTSTLDALQGIAKERGIQGLYRGLGPSCLKLVPAAGLSFMCYEALKRILLEEDEVEP
jgi:solute carrier family 25 phosphate transporter 23/24/25/41